MKNLSEMNLLEVADFKRQMRQIEERINIEETCEYGDFISTSGPECMMRIKLAWIIAIRMLRQLGVGIQTNEFASLDRGITIRREEQIDYVMENWYEFSEWAPDIMDGFLSEHGFLRDESYAAVDLIADVDDIPAQYEEWVKNELASRFSPYDIEKQIEVATCCADMCLMGTVYLYGYRCYRNKRIGKVVTYVLSQTSDAQEYSAGLMRELYRELSYNMYRSPAGVADMYVSADDGALVMRMIAYEWTESGENIDFALIRPFMLIDIALMERVCDIMEAEHPELIGQLEAVKGGDRCA